MTTDSLFQTSYLTKGMFVFCFSYLFNIQYIDVPNISFSMNILSNLTSDFLDKKLFQSSFPVKGNIFNTVNYHTGREMLGLNTSFS